MIKRTYSKRTFRASFEDVDTSAKRRCIESANTPHVPYSSSSPSRIATIFSDENAAPCTPPSSPPTVQNVPCKSSRSPLSGRPLAQKETSATTITTKLSQPKPKPKLTQMRLDLGQSTQKCCKTCGMHYRPASSEDRKLHDRFHDQNVSGIPIRSDMAHQLRATEENFCEELIVTIQNIQCSTMRKVVRKVLDVVESELGGVGIDDKSLWGSIEVPNGASSPPVLADKAKKSKAKQRDTREKCDRYCTFLYLKKEKVIGVLLAERIFSGHPVLGIPDKALVIGPDPRPATVGISRIWVSKHARGQGIARKLLDNARRCFVWQFDLPKTMVAFSQPTASGAMLASKWFGQEKDWLVYR